MGKDEWTRPIPTPLHAMKYGPREEILYVTCCNPCPTKDRTDYLATIDVDPKSPTYCEIIHKTYTGWPKDILHHSSWNACSSCHKCKHVTRDKLLMAGLESNRLYIIDTAKNPRAPEMYKIIERKEFDKLDCSFLHTGHCLPNGVVMISYCGDKDGNSKGNLLVLDAKTFEIKGYVNDLFLEWFDKPYLDCHDYWYQPYHDVMITTEIGSPNLLKAGFSIDKIPSYGRSIHFHSWSTRELLQSVDLGDDGIGTISASFVHNPKRSDGFVIGALSSNLIRFFKNDSGKWETRKFISINPKKYRVGLWIRCLGLMSAIILSLDDKFLYMSNFLHGDVRQYDISDLENPKLTGQVFLGGLIESDSKIEVLEDQDLTYRPDPVIIKGKRLYGGPHRLQLSLDGKRLYVTSELFQPWDRILYPEHHIHGGFLVKLDCDMENGV
ncbi:hypothetical protein FQA39_LY19067 [Lamprigera yunnana]|nr:hypothetical protein FQA39_LY19067 [Lamprigera yunnana]